MPRKTKKTGTDEVDLIPCAQQIDQAGEIPAEYPSPGEALEQPIVSAPQPKSYKSEQGMGLSCRKCGCRHFEVLDTRATYGGRIRRRRTCRHCGYS